MSIRTKIFLFVIPLVLVPLSFAGFFSFHLLTRGFEEQTYLADQQLSLAVTTRIEQLLDECHSNLILLSSILSTRLRQSEENSIEGLIQRVENHIEEITNTITLRFSPYLRIRIIAPYGREVFISGSDGREYDLGTVLDEPIFFQTISVSGQFPPVENKNDGSWVTTFSRSIVKDQTLLGLVYFDLDMKAIGKILDEISVSRPGYYFLFDGAGDELATAGILPLPETSATYKNIRSSKQRIRENPQPVFTHYPVRAGEQSIFLSSQPVREYIAFRDPIPQERWYLGIVHADTPILSAFRQSTKIFWIVLSIGLIIAIAGAFYTSGAITNPIRRLTAAVRDFSRGNLDSQVEITASDEIGHLAVDFNTMASEIKQLMKERQANETLVAIGRFSAALAHDLRNPVEGIKLLSGELKKRVGTKEPEHEIAEAITQSVENLSSFINQSLNFARLTQPVFERVNLASLADEVLQSFRFDDIALNKEYSNDLPPIEIDSVQIKRVMSNLIANALDSCMNMKSTRECVISLKITYLTTHIKIEVKDNGGGIPQEVRDKIFEPFFSTKPDGHGLGLALVRQIIYNHGGKITVESELNIGTNFIVELPLERKY